MKNKNLKFMINSIIIMVGFLVLFPMVELVDGEKIIKFSYNDDISEFEDNSCYNESYFYNEKRDVSIYDFEFKKILFFHAIILKYEKGNVCDTEYVLEEDYINNFLKNAIIEENPNNIDLAKLIEGKTAIVWNTRYLGNDYLNEIYYILDGKQEILSVFYVDDLIIILVGLSDEGPKYIAYK